MTGPQPDVHARPLRPRLDRLKIVGKYAPVGQQRPPCPRPPSRGFASTVGHLRRFVGGKADVWRGIVRQERQQAAPALILQLEGDLAGRGHVQISAARIGGEDLDQPLAGERPKDGDGKGWGVHAPSSLPRGSSPAQSRTMSLPSAHPAAANRWASDRARAGWEPRK